MSQINQTPQEIKLHTKSNNLELCYESGERFELSVEFLRVHSPSAEVMGHTPEEAVLQTGKRNVRIKSIEPVGNYALKIDFDDGHDTGLYSWRYLYDLGSNQADYWEKYLAKLKAANASRDPQFINLKVVSSNTSSTSPVKPATNNTASSAVKSWEPNQ